MARIDPTFTLRAVANPLDPYRSLSVLEPEWTPGLALPAYLGGVAAPDIPDLGLRAWINGVEVPRHKIALLIPRPGDLVVVCAHLGDDGGGGSGKSPLAMIGMLALAVVAPMAGAWLTTTALGAALGTFTSATAWNLVAGLGAGLVMMAGGALISAITPVASASSPVPTVSGSLTGASTGFGSNPSYGFSNTSNPMEEGASASFMFGIFRPTPRVIAWYIGTSGDNQVLNILYLVADHPVDAIEDIQINDSPAENFSGVTFEKRYGTLNQAPVSFFGDTLVEVTVNASILGTTVTRSLPGNATATIGAGVVFPGGLYISAFDGSPSSHRVAVTIKHRLVGAGSWTDWVSETISGAQANALRRFWTVSVPAGEYEIQATATAVLDFPAFSLDVAYGPGDKVKDNGVIYEYVQLKGGTNCAPPPDARVWREVSVSRIVSACSLEHIQMGITDDFCYPGASLLGVRIVGNDQLSGSWPKIRPLVTRGHVQVWNGTAWVYKASANPAWACWDLLVSDVYGPAIDKDRLIYSEFADWADHCDAQGYTVNIYFDGEAVDLSTALGNVSMAGRGLILQKGRDYGVAVDRVRTPVHKFGMGNIIRGSRRTKWLGAKDRANVIEATYYPADSDYQPATIEVRSDDYDEAATAIVRRSVTLYWCTDLAQAVDYCRLLLNKNRLQRRTVTFRASIDAIPCTLGDCAWFSHDTPRWGTSGRILHAGEQSVVLDREVTLEPGTTYYVQVRIDADDTLEAVPVQAVAETTVTDTLALTLPWTTIPDPYAIYSFGPSTEHSKAFEITSVSRSQSLEREITLLEYYDAIYDVDGPLPEVPGTTSGLALVAGLAATEVWRMGPDGSGQSVAVLSWRGVAPVWNVFYRRGSGAWVKAGSTQRPEFEVPGLVAGDTYTFAASPGGAEAGMSVTLAVAGKLAPPADVSGLVASQQGQDIVLTWTHNPDWDLYGYEVRMGASWDAGAVVADGVQENRAVVRPPLDGTYTLWVKAIDDTGNRSVNAVSAQISVVVESTLNVVRDVDETTLSPTPCPGTLTNMVWNGTAGTLDLDDPSAGAGSYVSEVYEVNAVSSISLRVLAGYTATLDTDVLTMQQLPGRTFQSFPADTFASVTSLASPVLSIRTSEDDETWGDWMEVAGAVDVMARYYQLRWEITPDNLALDFSFTSLRHLCDGPEIEARVTGQAVGSGGTTVTLADLGLSFLSGYAVGVTVLGSSFAVPAVEKTGLTSFTVRLFNAAGAGISGSVDLLIRGF